LFGRCKCDKEDDRKDDLLKRAAELLRELTPYSHNIEDAHKLAAKRDQWLKEVEGK
jgi:hypothetical protein